MRILAIIAVLLLTASGAWAQFVPPNGALPSGAECAAKVQPRPETKGQNSPYNQRIPTTGELAPFYANPLQFNGPPASSFFRVDGNFRGTTDEVIQWAACKWGMDVEQLRAQAWNESGWNQSVKGDDEFEHDLCTGGNGFDAWQPAGYCYTSYSIIQIKCTNYNACPMAYESTPFALDFRGSYWRACMNGEIKYYGDKVPGHGYPQYPNGTAQEMSDGCLGSWYSGNWYDEGALPYIDRVHQLMAEKPWLPALYISSPKQGTTVSGQVKVELAHSGNPGVCFYACLSSDMGFLTCSPGQGPWMWDTTVKVNNGTHVLTATAYTCGLSQGNDLPIGWPDAYTTVNVQNGATAVSAVKAPHGWNHKRQPHQQRRIYR